MKKVTTITKEFCQSIRPELNKLINDYLQKEYGLSGSLGSATYSDKEVKFKLEVKAEGVSTIKKQLAELSGWPEIGVSFKCNGVMFTVSDYDTKRRLRPIIATSAKDGQPYCFPADHVKKFIAFSASQPVNQ